MGRGAKRYLTRAEVAALFEVSPHTVARWARTGRLPSALTLGGRRRYPRDAVLRLVKALAVQEGGHSRSDRRLAGAGRAVGGSNPREQPGSGG